MYSEPVYEGDTLSLKRALPANEETGEAALRKLANKMHEWLNIMAEHVHGTDEEIATIRGVVKEINDRAVTVLDSTNKEEKQ
jgi:limonene-1,2-epoxide hydrolase